MVPITATVGDIDIQTSTLGNTYFNASTNVLKYSGNQTTGFYKEPIGVKNISRFGWRGLISGGFWFDEISDIGSGTVDLKSKDFPSNYFLFNNTKGFVVYPFHRNGSLNNDNYGSNGVKSAMLDKKRLSNLRFSYNSIYLDENKIYNFYDESNDNLNGISGVSVFNSDEVTLTKIPAPENSGLSDLYYYGNVDKVITPSLYGDKRNGYPILTTKIEPYKGDGTTKLTYHETFTSKYQKIDEKITSSLYGFDPISMRYKSTPHIVMALNYTKDNKQVTELQRFEEKGGLFSLFPKKVTGQEMNEFSSQLQSNLINLNNKINKTYKQFVDVYNALGPGLLESSYEAALIFELKDRGLTVKNQVELPIYYKGNKLDINYRMDIIVNDCVIVELKSVTELLPLHKKQLYTYLKLANKHLGILVNFNCNKILDNIVRVVCKVNNDADACE